MKLKYKLLLFWLIYSFFSNIIVGVLREYGSPVFEQNSIRLSSVSSLNMAFIGLFLIIIIVLPFALHTYNLMEKSPAKAMHFANLCFALGLILIAGEAYMFRLVIFLSGAWGIIFYVFLVVASLLFVLTLIANTKYWLIYITFIAISVFPYIFLLTGFGIGYSLATIWLVSSLYNRSVSNRQLKCIVEESILLYSNIFY